MSKLFEPGRNRIIAISVIGFAVLAIVAAITVGVLYRQGFLTDTNSTTVFDDEEQQRLEREEQERLRKQNKVQEMQRLVGKVTEMALEGAKRHWFHVRLGVFVGIVVANLAFCLLLWPGGFKFNGPIRKPTYQESIWASIKQMGMPILLSLLCLSELAAIGAMGGSDGTTGALYCFAASVGGFSLILIFDELRKNSAKSFYAAILALVTIIAFIIPTIHMGVEGLQLWS